jgi:hypothetical protein
MEAGTQGLRGTARDTVASEAGANSPTAGGALASHSASSHWPIVVGFNRRLLILSSFIIFSENLIRMHYKKILFPLKLYYLLYNV